MEKIAYGHVVDIEMYKDVLKQEGIMSLINNESERAMNAGFGAGIFGNVELLVNNEDVDKASKIIDDIKASNSNL